MGTGNAADPPVVPAPRPSSSAAITIEEHREAPPLGEIRDQSCYDHRELARRPRVMRKDRLSGQKVPDDRIVRDRCVRRELPHRLLREGLDVVSGREIRRWIEAPEA